MTNTYCHQRPESLPGRIYRRMHGVLYGVSSAEHGLDRCGRLAVPAYSAGKSATGTATGPRFRPADDPWAGRDTPGNLPAYVSLGQDRGGAGVHCPLSTVVCHTSRQIRRYPRGLAGRRRTSPRLRDLGLPTCRWLCSCLQVAPRLQQPACHGIGVSKDHEHCWENLKMMCQGISRGASKPSYRESEGLAVPLQCWSALP